MAPRPKDASVLQLCKVMGDGRRRLPDGEFCRGRLTLGTDLSKYFETTFVTKGQKDRHCPIMGHFGRIKKKLDIDPVEQETVELIFRLYLRGDGQSGPLGTKALVSWLNERGYRTRRGARFGVGTLHGILTNRVYIGEWIFNRRDSKTLRQKPQSEQITVPVPAIIERGEFERVQQTLAARNPKTTAPRVVTGPIL